MTRRKLKGYYEFYRCGCVSETVPTKRELLGYCPTHGEDAKEVYRDYHSARR